MNKIVISVALALLLIGCSPNKIHNRIHPNLATRLVKDYPELQHICDYAGGCENVMVECTRYDGYGNTSIRNETFWSIKTSSLMGERVRGTGWYPNDKPDIKGAINQAIEDYWYVWRFEHTPKDNEPVYPHSTNCDKDCGK